jgi:hypothetical protein
MVTNERESLKSGSLTTMPQWIVPLLIAVAGMIGSGAVTVFVAGKFTGKYTQALDGVIERMDRTDSANEKKFETLDEDKKLQWREIDTTGREVSYIKGQLSRGANGKAHGATS